MPEQSGVLQVAPDQPRAQLQAATPLPTPHVPPLLHVMPVQSAVAQLAPDQPDAQVHNAVPVPVEHVP